MHDYTKDNVTFLVTNQIGSLLTRSDLHRKKNSDIRIVLMILYFLKPKTIIVDLTAKF
jgi:hypothetical protein